MKESEQRSIHIYVRWLGKKRLVYLEKVNKDQDGFIRIENGLIKHIQFWSEASERAISSWIHYLKINAELNVLKVDLIEIAATLPKNSLSIIMDGVEYNNISDFHEAVWKINPEFNLDIEL